MKRILFSVLMISILLLTACSGPQAPQAVEPPAGPTATAEQVTLRFWTHNNNSFNAGYDALIKAYQEKHSNVTITRESFDYELYLQTLQTAMPAGEEADIIQLFGTWTSQYYERLVPVPLDVMSLDQAKQTYYSAPVGGFTVEGKLYGMPQEYNMEYGGVLVNKTMYQAAGLAFPPQWKTLDDVVSDGVKLAQKDGSGMMSVAGWHFTNADPISFSFLAGIKQRGGDYWNADHTGFTFNTTQAKDQLSWMVEAVKKGMVDPVVYNDATNPVIDAFFTNKAAIGYIGAWAIAEGKTNFPDFKDEWDYVFLPPVQGKPTFVADSGWGLTVSPHSKHQQVAWDFIKFVAADPQNALAWNLASGTIPAMPEVAKSPQIATQEPWVTKALDTLPYGEYLGNMPDRDLVMYEIIYPHVLEALQGVKSVDETLAAIDSEANSTFKK